MSDDFNATMARNIIASLQRELTQAREALAAKDAENEKLRKASYPIDREFLGQIVRVTWVEWAKERADPKPHWLTPWENLSEPMKEVDRLIGEKVASVSIAIMEREIATLRRDAARAAAKADGDDRKPTCPECNKVFGKPRNSCPACGWSTGPDHQGATP